MPIKNAVDKQLYKFQEGLAYLALTKAYGKKNYVLWNCEKSKIKGNTKKMYTHSEMSIDPDIVIGYDNNTPYALVFVTHGNATQGSEKKFWRSVAEAVEEKALPSHPYIFSVLYAGNVKQSIMEAYESLFDGVFHLDTTSDGIQISEDLRRLASENGNVSFDESLQLLKKYIKKKQSLWNSFLNGIKQMISNGYGPHHNTLISVTAQKKSRVPIARNTSLRRSINKLATLPLGLVQDILSGKTEVKCVPKHSVILGWFVETIVSYKLVDNELKTFIKETDHDIIRYEQEKIFELERMVEYINELNSISVLAIINEWIIKHFEILCTLEGMRKYIEIIFKDSFKPLRGYLSEEECPKQHWLFDSMMKMLRTETGRKDGYGYSALARDAGDTKGITTGYISVADLKNRKRSLDVELTAKVAKAFSYNLKRLGKNRAKELFNNSLFTYCNSMFNYEIETYPLHHPIDYLVCRDLDAKGIKYEASAGHPSFLTEILPTITTETKNIIKVADGRIWIKCQSSFNGHTDKRKELCGRIAPMKLCYSENELKKKLFILVIDGLFSQEDIDLLDAAGWDGIYYFDETTEMVEDLEGFLSINLPK